MRFCLTFLLGILVLSTSAQSTFAPLNSDYSHLIERYEVKSGILSNKLFSNVKSVRRKDLVGFTTELLADTSIKLSNTDYFNILYLQNDSWEWLNELSIVQNESNKPFLKHFLKKESDFYNFHNDDFDLHISPIFQFAFAKDNIVKNQPFVNTRGVEMRGMINKKLGFYSMLTENQITYPSYVRDYARFYSANPYEGFTKITKDDSTKLVTDFFTARGYVTFKPLKSIQLQFGHDKNFIGSGIRSMILSDFSAPYLHLKVITQIGRFQYLNIFAQTINRQVLVAADGTEQIPPKYFTFHHLSLNISKNLNIGLFETIVFGNRKIGFDINYLNPIIFYRFVEGHLGSVDNSIAGADFKLNFLRHFSLYGQLVLDEFNLEHFKKKGWWSTKYATQLGGRYIDALDIKNFDLQVEYNMARPYTYSHNSTYSNFVHYNLPMAHPLGSNFREFLFLARYQTAKRLFLNLTLMSGIHGEDFDTRNWGGNVQRNYNLFRPKEYGNVVGQGLKVNIRHMEIGASYMLAHNLFADMKFQNRNVSFANDASNINNTVFSFGIRWNAAQRQLLF